MLLYGMNDIARNEMYNFDEKDIILFLDKLENDQKNFYLRIMVTDALHVLSKRKNVFHDDKLSLRLYNILLKNDFEHIKEVLEDNYNLLQVLFINAKGFYQIPLIDRCLLITDSSKELNDKLLSLNKFYLIDAFVYVLKKDMESINSYYNDYFARLGSKYIGNFYQLVLFIMQNLKVDDLKLYNKNFLEILKDYYIGSKFLQSIGQNSILETQKYSDMLEQKEILDVIELIEKDQSVFFQILSLALEYRSGMSKTKEEEEFISKNITPTMIKKLEINKNSAS